jgi:hypothetical protein
MEPIRFRCPSCDQALRVGGEKAGRRVRCTRCRALVDAPGAEEEEPTPAIEERANGDETETAHDEEVEQEERPTRRRRPRRSDQWRLARLGILVLLVGTGLGLLWSLFNQTLWMGSGRLLMRPGVLNVLLWLSGGFTVVSFLTQIVGYGLCAAAPRESGVRPFAVTALICTVLTAGLSLYITRLSFASLEQSMEALRDLQTTPQLRSEKDPKKALEQSQKMLEHSRKMAELSQKMLEDSMGFQRRVKLFEIGQSLLSGVLVFAVPLMLRAFCRALRLVELEPNCDGLLKIGAAAIGIQLLMRLIMGLVGLMRAAALFGPIGFLAAMLHLAWSGLLLVLLWQIWQAMPARRA